MVTDGAVRRSRRANAIAWLGLVAAAVAIHAAYWLISAPESLFSDFLKAYFHAAETLFEQGPVPTWPLSEDSAEVGFVNLPVLAWLFVPLVPLGELGAGWVFLGLGIAATLTAYALILRFGKPNRRLALALLVLFLANGPLVNSFREGNTTHFVLLLLVAALLLWRARLDYAAGLVLGFCALIKLPLMLFGAYFLLRGRWRIVAGGATMVAGAALLSLAIFGLEINIGWYEACVAPFMRGAIAAFNVQSIDGFLIRLTTGADELDNWFPLEPSLAHRVARVVILAGLFIGAFWLIWRAHRRALSPAAGSELSSRDLLEYVIVLNLALVTTPVSWSHYYLFMLLPWGLYIGGHLPLPEDATTRWLVWSSWLLSSLPVVVPPTEPEWLAEVLSRTAVSAWLFGGLLMLAALARGALLPTGAGGRALLAKT